MPSKMMHRTATVAFLAILATVPTRCEVLRAQAREWTDNTGKYKFQAEFIRVQDDIAILKSEVSGNEKEVPLNRLSELDRKWIDEFLASHSGPPKSENVLPDSIGGQPSTSSDGSVEMEPNSVPPPIQPARPQVVKSKPVIIRLDPSFFSQSDKPPSPNPISNDVTPSESTPPVSSPPSNAAKKFANTSNATEIPAIGDVDLQTLEKLPAPFSDFALTASTSQELSKVREALGELGQLAPESVNESVLNLLRNQTQAEDQACRIESLKSLAKISPDTCLPFVIRAVDDNTYEVKWLAFELLKQLRDLGCIEPLTAKFASPDRAQIVSILEMFGPHIETLIQPLVSHSSSDVRLDAVRLLGRTGTAASLDVLKTALNDKNGIVRLQAKSAIKSIESRK